MNYSTEVKVKEITKEQLLAEYRMEGATQEACSLCPDYRRVWSCPPGLPDTASYLEPYRRVYLIAVKVCYSEEDRSRIVSREEAEAARKGSYEQVKRTMLLALLEKEKENPGSKVLGAGRCILCDRCARADGKPCRYPEKRRYSITGFGFDFSKLLKEVFDISLLWSSDGLPEYDVAVAALFVQ
ncbi:MAG: DUF2284 domain-containing protein [Fusicatenibacter sp.]|nr:DUF2284 domain-containing protein [Fusicatenibacter sp.]